MEEPQGITYILLRQMVAQVKLRKLEEQLELKEHLLALTIQAEVEEVEVAGLEE